MTGCRCQRSFWWARRTASPPIAIARATARALPGEVDYRELPGVGHWLFHEPVVNRVVEEMDIFLKRW